MAYSLACKTEVERLAQVHHAGIPGSFLPASARRGSRKPQKLQHSGWQSVKREDPRRALLISLILSAICVTVRCQPAPEIGDARNFEFSQN